MYFQAPLQDGTLALLFKPGEENIISLSPFLKKPAKVYKNIDRKNKNRRFIFEKIRTLKYYDPAWSLRTAANLTTSGQLPSKTVLPQTEQAHFRS